MRLVSIGILAALMMLQQSALAAPNDYEIDLKELRRSTPPRPEKSEPKKRHHRASAETKIDNSTASEHESIYVVLPGEHLFQILMKKYGLSDPEAERLIPGVMKLNGISSPKGLKVGQRLRIPLPAVAGSRSAAIPPSVPAPGRAAPAADLTTASQPALAQVTTKASPTLPAAQPLEAEIISIISESPCKLARNLAKKLGLFASSTPGIEGMDSVDAGHAERSVTVVCGVSEAEQYTYERLLAHRGKQLLFFDEDDSANNVVEELADTLGLEFQKRDADATALPLTYVFAPFGTRTRELHMTIFPAAQQPQKQP